MRIFCLTFLGLVCAIADANAQQPSTTQPPQVQPQTPAAPLDPTKNPLDGYLLRWQEAMAKVNTIALACTRTDDDKVYQEKKVYEGTIHFMKPNLVFLNLTKKDKKEDFERVICSGTYIYHFVPSLKEIRVYPAPKPTPGQASEDNSLGFLFGMKAEEAKRRYDLKLFKEDQLYVYVDVFPKAAADKAEFSQARLILSKETFLPRQLWFQQPNKNETVWDIPNIQSGVQINKGVFGAPQVPTGWKMVQGQEQKTQTDVPPRVIRTNR